MDAEPGPRTDKPVRVFESDSPAVDRLRGTSQGGRPAVGANDSGHWRPQGQGAGVQAPALQWSRVAARPRHFRVTGCAGCAVWLPLGGAVEATGSPCGS